MNRQTNEDPIIHESLDVPPNSLFQLSRDKVNLFILISYKEDDH